MTGTDADGGSEALDLVRGAFEETAGLDRRSAEGDRRARQIFGRVISEEIEFAFVGPSWAGGHTDAEVSGLPGSGRGRREFGAGWRGWLEPFDSYRMWPVEYAVAGDRVMVITRTEVTLAGTSVPMETDQGTLSTVRDGQIVRMELYYHADDARAALEQG